MPLKMLLGFLTALDIYGHPIGLHYKGDSTYKTRLGSLVTLLTYALLLVNLIGLIKKFVNKTD